MKRTETAAWVKKAESDLAVVRQLTKNAVGPWDAVCFHAHQCVEKMLKAFLVDIGLCPERTHDLIFLLTACRRYDQSLEPLAQPCRELNPYAVQVRYPDELAEPSEDDARKTAKNAEMVYACVKAKLDE